MRGVFAVELPHGVKVRGEFAIFEIRAEHLDRHWAFVEDGVVELAIGHLMRIDKLAMHGAELQSSHEVGTLVERADGTVEGAADFGECILGFEAYVVDEELDALLRSPLAQVKVHGEDDAGGAVHAPDKSADTLFGGALEAFVVEEHLPPECVALSPEGR